MDIIKGNSVNTDDLQAHKLKYYFENLDDKRIKSRVFKPYESYYKSKWKWWARISKIWVSY